MHNINFIGFQRKNKPSIIRIKSRCYYTFATTLFVFFIHKTVFTACNLGINILLLNASLNHSASWPRSASIHQALRRSSSVAVAAVQLLIWPAVMKKLKGRPLTSIMARSLVLMPSLVRPIRRLRSPFYPKAGSSAVGLAIGCINHAGRGSALCTDKPSLIRVSAHPSHPIASNDWTP